ncbi:TIGR03749 family integrating conjugative element protein [Klebsiella aerogenes]|uniref:TIGR03749 family integrating conjugative element protein n=1 Tax=Klebsiella aerogenes TaxID=548 RepID=A0AAP9U7U5_KLEAE|nr:TIGR03749 family integrating conjugative element protein [Klebsiella aerogenes]QMR42919.1 TIGR03749 family integrating conjugative element protein [Klebsiella aerogenes]
MTANAFQGKYQAGRAFCLAAALLPVATLFTTGTTAVAALTLVSSPVYADTLIKWDRLPLAISLQTGTERVIFVDKNVRVGFPPALNGKLRVQSTGGAVYLKASSDFPQTRLQLQDAESGEIILLDVTATAKAPGAAEPVKIVYDGDVSTLSSAGDVAKQDNDHGGRGRGSGDGVSPASAGTASAKARKKPAYSAPLPVLLTRYAAQSLYAPVRTVEAVPGIRPVNPHLPKNLHVLYPSEPLQALPVAAWTAGGRSVVAVRVRNTASRRIPLDPRALQGQFVAATFQHRWLGPAGTPEDTTTLYLVVSGQIRQAFGG